MRDDMQLPVLTFPLLPVGRRETPPDLARWLYKGGAATRADAVIESIQGGLLGSLLSGRLELVRALHQVIDDKLAGGGSHTTAWNLITETNRFVVWADEVDAPLTMEGLSDTYVRWTEHLLHRCKVKKEVSENTIYHCAGRIGDLFDIVLGRQKPLLHLTRVSRPSKRKAPLGPEAEKQSLEGTFAFGHLLQDICDSLTLQVVWGSFNVHIQRANSGALTLWTGGSVPKRKAEWVEWEVRQAEARLQAYIDNPSLEHRGRKAVVNVRILAEMLMFIGQTGMNLAQAHQLKLRHFSYSSDIDGYKVRDYKRRRGGEVLFEIFSEYRPHFERYLSWRRELFPNTEELFPVLREGSLNTRAPRFDLVIALCKQAKVPWMPPSTLRGTRVNWLLRRSGDPQMTAEMAQHHRETLLTSYEKPSLQRAMSEVTRFWQTSDPILVKAEPRKSVAPGECDGKPSPSSEKPPTAPEPDCARPSGCLWCEHHRDLDTLDYVWGLVTFRHLKVLELSKHCFPAEASSRAHPAQHAVDKLSDKLAWFKSSNATRNGWVEESLARVEEGRYQPDWERIINDVEGGEQ